MAHRKRLPGFEALPMLLQVEEVAAILRMTPKAVYTMVERGEIPGVVRIGRRIRFKRDVLEQWILSHSQ